MARTTPLLIPAILFIIGCAGGSYADQDGKPDKERNGENQPPFTLHEQSSLQLAGTATIGSWDSHSQRVGGRIEPGVQPQQVRNLVHTLTRAVEDERDPDEVPLILEADENGPNVRLSVPVQSLRSGNRRMEADMQEALRAQAHPHIIYSLQRVSDAQWHHDDGQLRFELIAVGQLTLAGVRRTVRIPVVITPQQRNRFRVVGEKTFQMSDFDIEPPTALFGLIKARETVHVTFDLFVDMNEEPEDPS